jgi:hypothetical protein
VHGAGGRADVLGDLPRGALTVLEQAGVENVLVVAHVTGRVGGEGPPVPVVWSAALSARGQAVVQARAKVASQRDRELTNKNPTDALGSCKWVRFAGEGRESGGDFLDAGADVGRGGACIGAAVGVACVGAGYGVAEVAFDPG